MRVVAALVSCAVALAPAGSYAQEPAAPKVVVTETAQVDVSALGVSFARIQRQLAADAQARTEGGGPLRLEYYVDVYGTAPALRFFATEDLVNGAVPGSAPTHRDMLYQMTPQLFRQPTVDFLGLAVAAGMVAAKKTKDWRYERELQAYKRLIESGKIVPAPRPPGQK